VSVAQLWEGAHVFSGNKETHPSAASGVSWTQASVGVSVLVTDGHGSERLDRAAAAIPLYIQEHYSKGLEEHLNVFFKRSE